jgi:hypothetical protein
MGDSYRVARLPTPGSDVNSWGDILNDFLKHSHNSDGSLKESAIQDAIPDATTTSTGIVQLTGDLGGTASSPTVPGLAGKADDAAVVHTSGSEGISGVKSFVSSPVVPNATVANQAMAFGQAPQYPNSSGAATVVPRRYTFDVRDYGAVGDGATNDAAAIQAAINAAGSGGTVLFPAATYAISTAIDLKPNIHYQGVPGATILKARTGFSGPMVTISWPAGQAFGNRYGHLDGFVIDGNSQAGVTVGLDVGLAVAWKFDQIRTSGDLAIGLRLDGTQNSQFDKCEIWGKTCARLANGAGGNLFNTCQFALGSVRHLHIENDASLPSFQLTLFGDPPRTCQNTFVRCIFEFNGSAAPDYTIYIADAMANHWQSCAISGAPTIANVFMALNTSRHLFNDPFFAMTANIPAVINEGYENEISAGNFDTVGSNQHLVETRNKTFINGWKASSTSAVIVNTLGSATVNIHARPSRLAGLTSERPTYGTNGVRPAFYDMDIGRWISRNNDNDGVWQTWPQYDVGSDFLDVDATGNTLLGVGAPATSATNGFAYLPAMAGVPTGIPTAKTGRAPLVEDTTNGILWGYLGGAWRAVGSAVRPMATPMRTGLWYGPQGSATTVAPATNVLHAVPIYIGNAVTLTSIGINVTGAGAGGTVIRLGIYSDIVDTRGGYPGNLLLDAGTVAGDSVAFVSTAISQAVAPGLYWLACVAQGGTPTVSVVNGPNPYVGHNGASGVGSRAGYRQSSVSGALPATFTTTVDAQGTIPLVQIKV